MMLRALPHFEMDVEASAVEAEIRGVFACHMKSLGAQFRPVNIPSQNL